MRVRMRGASVVLVAAALVLAACGSNGGPRHQPSTGRGSTGSSSAATARDELMVYLCAKDSPAPCSGRTTAAQTAAIRQRLLADPDVGTVRYRSELDQYRAAKTRLPTDVASQVQLGDLPAAFVVSVRKASRIPVVAARYRHLAGVSTVKACTAACR